MRDDSDFPHTHKLFASFVLSTKHWSLLNSLNINQNLLFEVVVIFCYFFRFSHMYIVFWGLSPWKKDFASVSLLPFTKKLSKSSYDVTMTYYTVTLILFFFTFVANVRDLQWNNFLILTMNRKGVIGIYLPRTKMMFPGLHGPKITQA